MNVVQVWGMPKMGVEPGSRAARRADELRSRITTAALTFEGRWTMTALRRAEPGLALRLDQAWELWRSAIESGLEEEILRCGEVLCRGYGKCTEVMAVLGQKEDAYLFGRDPETGFTISIGGRAAAARVAELYPGIPHYSPDDIAVLLGKGGLAPVNEIMAAWPGAEVVEVRRLSHEG